MTPALRDFYEGYISNVHPQLRGMCGKANRGDLNAIIIDLTNIEKYCLGNDDLSVWDIYLLLNKSKFESLLNHSIEQECDILNIFFSHDLAILDLVGELKLYFEKGFDAVKKEFNESLATHWARVYGRMLINNETYLETLYHASVFAKTPCSDKKIKHFDNLYDALGWCLKEEFQKFANKMNDYCNNTNQYKRNYLLVLGSSWNHDNHKSKDKLKSLLATDKDFRCTYRTYDFDNFGMTPSISNYDFLFSQLEAVMSHSDCLLIMSNFYEDAWTQLEIQVAHKLCLPIIAIPDNREDKSLPSDGDAFFADWDANQIDSMIKDFSPM